LDLLFYPSFQQTRRPVVPLQLVPTLYAVLVFPLLWGVMEQETYNGYLLPRFRILSESTAIAVAIMMFSWSFQHVVLPLTFDPKFMAYRLLSPIPFSIFIMLVSCSECGMAVRRHRQVRS
jgi:hypothetical protein